MTNKPEYFVIEPPRIADACVIWLHGLGASGKDFMGIEEQLGLPADHGVRFVFPNAPFMSITINNGMRMRAWYDIYDFNMLDKEDILGVKRSQEYISAYIEEQANKGIAYERIILGGFSQGGVMTLYTALNYEQRLGGAISLSAYMLLTTNLNLLKDSPNKNIPIFLAHGTLDEIVPFSLGIKTRDLLSEAKYSIQWHAYPMQHNVCLDEINAIGLFVRECLYA